MQRAKTWSPVVEDTFRLQEAGYKGLEEHSALGQPPPERWEESGFIRKLRTKYSLTEKGGQAVLLYFRHDAECQPNYLNRVKLYQY